MPADDVFTQRAAYVAQLRADLIEYEKALGVVRAFEAKYPQFAASHKQQEPALAAPRSDESAAGSVAAPEAEPLKGSNMQETVFNAALNIPVGVEFAPARVVEILEEQAPLSKAFYEIDEKKARDALGRLAKDPGRGLKRTRAGTRGPHGRPPEFRRFEASEEPADSAEGVAETTMADYAVSFLGKCGPPFRDTNELIDGMKSLGWCSDAKDAYSSVFGTLRREPEKEDSRLTKRGGKWGLKEWPSETDGEKEEVEEKPRPVLLTEHIFADEEDSEDEPGEVHPSAVTQ